MLTTVKKSRTAPVLPLLTLGGVLFANLFNRCGDGFCQTFGWPWIAFYGPTDAVVEFNGQLLQGRHGVVPLAFAGNLAVAALLLVGSLALQSHWRRPASN